jgi:hypothetical protein
MAFLSTPDEASIEILDCVARIEVSLVTDSARSVLAAVTCVCWTRLQRLQERGRIWRSEFEQGIDVVHTHLGDALPGVYPTPHAAPSERPSVKVCIVGDSLLCWSDSHVCLLCFFVSDGG